MSQRCLRFTALLTDPQTNTWTSPCHVVLHRDGTVASLSRQKPRGVSKIENIPGYGIPGLTNAHSHAFQYAMTGLTECLGSGAADDDFWSWRERMYALALQVSPDDLEHIATMLYAEMLRLGFTHVVEFHYLHLDPRGKPYRNIAEMGIRLLRAAETAGIGMTLTPVFYHRGGFHREPSARQVRFCVKDVDEFARLLEASRQAVAKCSDARTGVSVHSLRAATSADIKTVFHKIARVGEPKHIHIAEQKKEVSECLEALGKTPVRWMLDNIGLDASYALVHCTQATEDEIDALAKSRANVVICPTTEGNLGDGIFRTLRYWRAGGTWSIGTDSHVGLHAFEELRLLDYCQRFVETRRNPFCATETEESGHLLFQRAREGGLASAGLLPEDQAFPVGKPFDCVVLRADHPALVARPLGKVFSSVIFSADASCFFGTLKSGRWQVKDGIHHKRDQILSAYKKTLKRLYNSSR